MEHQHKVIRNLPQETIWKFERDIPYIPHNGDMIIFPEGWKTGEWFEVTDVEHYLIDKLIVIKVNGC